MSRRSMLSTMALAAVLVLSVPGLASADVAVSHSGSVGKHSLTDNDEYSGAQCIYNDEQDLGWMRVTAPTVFARSRTAARDQQWVGWRVELQYRDGGSWSTVQKSDPMKYKAWDDTPAAFRTTTVAIHHPVGGGEWRVVVRMTWYKPGTSNVWQGTARHRVEHYTYELAEPGVPTECPAGIL